MFLNFPWLDFHCLIQNQFAGAPDYTIESPGMQQKFFSL